MTTTAPLLEVHSIRQAFPKPDGSQLLVLDDLNLELADGQIRVREQTVERFLPGVAGGA